MSLNTVPTNYHEYEYSKFSVFKLKFMTTGRIHASRCTLVLCVLTSQPEPMRNAAGPLVDIRCSAVSGAGGRDRPRVHRQEPLCRCFGAPKCRGFPDHLVTSEWRGVHIIRNGEGDIQMHASLAFEFDRIYHKRRNGGGLERRQTFPEAKETPSFGTHTSRPAYPT
jgi:hypothetical protein